MMQISAPSCWSVCGSTLNSLCCVYLYMLLGLVADTCENLTGHKICFDDFVPILTGTCSSRPTQFWLENVRKYQMSILFWMCTFLILTYMSIATKLNSIVFNLLGTCKLPFLSTEKLSCLNFAHTGDYNGRWMILGYFSGRWNLEAIKNNNTIIIWSQYRAVSRTDQFTCMLHGAQFYQSIELLSCQIPWLTLSELLLINSLFFCL